MRAFLFGCLTVITWTPAIAAAQAAEPSALSDAERAEIRRVIDDAANDTAAAKFKGIEFGMGLGLAGDLDEDKVETARVVSGIVRVEDSPSSHARVFLEAHQFVFTWGSDRWGSGPFVAIQPGDGELLNAMALGWMIGFRKSTNRSSSFNIGVGYLVDNKVKKLGDGLVAGQVLPAGEVDIRYKHEADHGYVVIVSFTF